MLSICNFKVFKNDDFYEKKIKIEKYDYILDGGRFYCDNIG